MSTDTLTAEQKDFLAICEEELKHRYTEKDEDFMKVLKAEPSKPPIVDPWMPQNTRRNNDRRFNRRYNPYERHGNRGNRGDRRGHSDYGTSHGYYRSRYNT